MGGVRNYLAPKLQLRYTRVVVVQGLVQISPIFLHFTKKMKLMGFASQPQWPSRSHKGCWDDDGARGGGGGRADPRSAAFYCTTPKGFIMPFVITLTAVNTGEPFYVPDQCKRFIPIINQERNLL